jgi:hypothetical protein
MAFRKKRVVEGTQVQARTQALLGLGAQLKDRELAELAAESRSDRANFLSPFRGGDRQDARDVSY